MKVQIQNITPKALFKIVFAVYLLLGMHINMDHLGGYGLKVNETLFQGIFLISVFWGVKTILDQLKKEKISKN